MALLKLDQACLAFGHVPLLDHADFQLDPGERVALIGRNGTGKSSLLAVLAGLGTLDDGLVWRQPGLRLAYVAQEPEMNPEHTVFEALVSGLGEVSRLLEDYHRVSHALGEPEADHEPLLEQLQQLQNALEAQGAWSWQTQVERVMDRFGLDPEAQVARLSGGQKKRLALAQGLAMSPDVLLLDEPTNHLDIAAIEWLEEVLLESGVALLLITHDRQFLDRLATRIVELDRGQLVSFPGRYATYLERKEAMLHDERVLNEKFDKLLKEEEAWIRKGVEARRTRAVFRVQRLERLRQERSERRERLGQVQMNLTTGGKSGELVVEAEHLNKAFAGKVIARDFSARILRGDKIGLIGPNGVGKTTLLRMILGELPPDSGSIRQGTRIEVAYFDQFRLQLDPEASLAEVISPGSDYVQIGGTKKHVIGYLEDFLFAPERARSPVKSLSGGERNRLLLARLFAKPANVLVLDEPTNDLDVETLELLEQLLQDYPGTLFLVSHDRAFIDQVVTQTLVAEGDGLWREYAGGYSDWAAYRDKLREVAKEAAREVASQASQLKPTARSVEGKTGGKAMAANTPAPSTPAKLSWKEMRELEALPEQIAALEAEQAHLDALLADASLYQRDPGAAQQAAERLHGIEDELMQLLERWESLESRQSRAV